MKPLPVPRERARVSSGLRNKAAAGFLSRAGRTAHLAQEMYYSRGRCGGRSGGSRVGPRFTPATVEVIGLTAANYACISRGAGAPAHRLKDRVI